MTIRKRILPSGWYPGSGESCRSEIEGFQEYIKSFPWEDRPLSGGIVPHAGWYFSGRLAALVLDLMSRSGAPDVVAVFGGHLGAGRPIIYAEQAWDTPLGPIEIDKDLTRALMDETSAHAEGSSTKDNTVEIQLPLVKYYFPDSRVVAFRSPHSAESIALGSAAVRLAREQGKSILVIGSTDLTHYGPNYGFTPRGRGAEALRWVREENDRGFIDQVLEMNPEGLLDHAARHHSACSAGGVASAVAACRELGSTQAVLLDYYTSHDVMPGDSFVGYAGMVF